VDKAIIFEKKLHTTTFKYWSQGNWNNVKTIGSFRFKKL